MIDATISRADAHSRSGFRPGPASFSPEDGDLVTSTI
jgi:hypothetical protein